jgi:hypothetical protein
LIPNLPWQIGHRGERGGAFFVQPIGQLSGAKERLLTIAKHLSQLIERQRFDVRAALLRHRIVYRRPTAASNIFQFERNHFETPWPFGRETGFVMAPITAPEIAGE